MIASMTQPKKASGINIKMSTVVVPSADVQQSTSIYKQPKTVIDNGLHYSLLSRVRNAFSPRALTKLEEPSTAKITLVDGRGQSRDVHPCWIDIALAVGGAEQLKLIRTSHVRRILLGLGYEL